MGLVEQGGNLRTVESLGALHPTPPERGYPGLTFKRRGFLSLATRLIVPSAVATVAFAATRRRVEADGGQPLVGPDYLDNYIAGGKELNDPGQFSDRVFPHPLTGSAVLVSPDVFQALGAPSLNQLAQRVKNSPWGQPLNWASRFESAVLAINEAYGFKSVTFPASGTVRTDVFSLDNPSGTRISVPDRGFGLRPKWWESKDLAKSGLVLSDGYTVSYDYDGGSNQWIERDDYESLGSAQARITKNLAASVTELALNPKEVDQFAQTGDDGGLTSFQVIRKPNGEPVFFAVTSGPFGLDSNLGNLQAMPEAAARLSTMTWRDGNLLDLMTQRWGLKSVSAGQDPGLLTVISMRGENTAATFSSNAGRVILNEINSSGRNWLGVINLMDTLIAESRHIDRLRHSRDDISSLDPNSGVDKAMVLEEIANENRLQYSTSEYDYVVSIARYVADQYRMNPI